MSDIVDDKVSVPSRQERKHGWRRPADPAASVLSEPETTDPARASRSPRNVGPLVALALLGAAALIIALAVITVTAGTGDAPDLDATEPADGPLEGTAGTTGGDVSLGSIEVTSTSVSPATSIPTATAVPPQPIEIGAGELVLTTFYREVPVGGGEFSLAVRLENSSGVEFAISDLEFSFDIAGDALVADEIITEHARVPGEGSAVVTVRAVLPPLTTTPALVVSAVNGELARAMLP